MSDSYPTKTNQNFDEDPSTDMSPKFSHKSSSTVNLLRSDSSSSAHDFPQQTPNKRVVKSCLWSTVIFSINFVSSILVINLAKW